MIIIFYIMIRNIFFIEINRFFFGCLWVNICLLYIKEGMILWMNFDMLLIFKSCVYDN